MKLSNALRFVTATVATCMLTSGTTAARANEPRLDQPTLLQQKVTFTAIALPAGFEGQALTNNSKALGYNRGRDGLTPFGVIWDYRTGTVNPTAFMRWSTPSVMFTARPGGLLYIGQDYQTELPFMIQASDHPMPPLMFRNFKLGVSEINDRGVLAGTDWSNQGFPRTFRMTNHSSTPEYAPNTENSIMHNLGNNGVALIGTFDERGNMAAMLWNPDNSLTPLSGAFPLDMNSAGTIVAGSTIEGGATLWHDGVEENLGLGEASTAIAVNNSGNVLVATFSERHGETISLLRNKKLTPLSKLVKLPMGWKIARVIDLNDKSEILVEIREMPRRGRQQPPAGVSNTVNAILLPRK